MCRAFLDGCDCPDCQDQDRRMHDAIAELRAHRECTARTAVQCPHRLSDMLRPMRVIGTGCSGCVYSVAKGPAPREP